MTYYLYEYTQLYSEKNPSYKFPHIIDLIPSIYFCVLHYLLYKLFVYFLFDWTENFLEEKYITGEEKELKSIYKTKFTIYIFKFSFFAATTIFGYLIMKDLYFFPRYLGGSGDFRELFLGSFDKVIYWEKPKYFDLFYNNNLGYTIFDFAILFTQPKPSDYNMLLLHHFSTISLVVYSFLNNYSNYGGVVFYLHYFSDGLVYIIRLVIQSNTGKYTRILGTIFFVVVFAYFRLFVFGTVIYDSVFYLKSGKGDEPWNIFDYSLNFFMVFLYILHIVWVSMIIKKILLYAFNNKCEDVSVLKVRKNLT